MQSGDEQRHVTGIRTHSPLRTAVGVISLIRFQTAFATNQQGMISSRYLELRGEVRLSIACASSGRVAEAVYRSYRQLVRDFLFLEKS